jgi:hypothetical protein
MLELLGQVHIEILIKFKGSFVYIGCQLCSPILLVEVEESLFKSWVALYVVTRVWRRGERDIRVLASPSPW